MNRTGPLFAKTFAAFLIVLLIAVRGSAGVNRWTSRGPTRRDLETSPGQLQSQINTHSLGWLTLSFLVSFLWFKIGNHPVFPLGFVGGLAIGFWSSEIDRALAKPSFLGHSITLSIVGMVLGLFINRGL